MRNEEFRYASFVGDFKAADAADFGLLLSH